MYLRVKSLKHGELTGIQPFVAAIRTCFGRERSMRSFHSDALKLLLHIYDLGLCDCTCTLNPLMPSLD